ncbi:hypothetical protein AeMF1_018458 [Aphanomyces euteiches]|nr:hypothetical protein AeMF1_018458 [Aphanomyces euteiches]
MDASESSSSSSEEEMMTTMHVLCSINPAVSGTNLFVEENGEEDFQGCVDRSQPVRDMMTLVSISPYIFKTMTNFTQTQFEEFSRLVCPVIASNARTTGLQHRPHSGRRPKLCPQQRLLAFVLYLKHDNLTTYVSVNWNWSRSAANDDLQFIASCVNVACKDEIRWPNATQREQLASTIPNFPGCIGFIDGTLCKIRRPYNNPLHKNWYNGRKHMYCFNNTVVVDHSGLIIFEDNGYPGRYHDVNILRQSSLYQHWRDHFTVEESYFEYLLGDPGYVGEEMFIMRRIGSREFADGVDISRINLFNKMHAGYRIKVEWELVV